MAQKSNPIGPRRPRGSYSLYGPGDTSGLSQTRTSSSPASSNSSSSLLAGANRASSSNPEMNNNHHNPRNCFAETKWIHSKLALRKSDPDEVHFERIPNAHQIRFYRQDSSSNNKNHLDCTTTTNTSTASSTSSPSSSSSSLSQFTPPPANIICEKQLTLEARNTPLEWRGDLLAAKLQLCHPNIVAYHGCEPTLSKDNWSVRTITLQMDGAERLCFHNFTEDIAVYMSKRREKFSDGSNPSQVDQLENTLIHSCLKSVARQALLGLFTLYKVHNILHRDVKPGNLLIFENGAVRLTDFETAVPDPGHHASQTKTGTPIFQAPELRDSYTSTRNTDKSKADVWSLGMTLLYSKVKLMFGLDPAKRLKSSNSTVQKFEKLVNGNVGDLASGVREMTEIAFSDDFGLKQLVREMLSVDLEKRLSVTQALAMTFVLTPKICLALQKNENKNSSASITLQNQHQQGWSPMKQLHRDVEAEKILRDEFEVKTCDDFLIGVDIEVNSNNNNSNNSNATSSAFTWKNFDEKVNRVHKALSEEAAQLVLHANSIQNHNNSEIASTTVEQWTKIRYLMNQRVVYRRQFEQVEMLREIIALIPMATTEEVQNFWHTKKK